MSVSIDARRYARLRYRVLLVDLIGWLAFLWAYQSMGFSTHTARWASAFSFVEPVTILVYLAIFGGCSYVVFFPLHLYRDFLLEHRFGLSRLTFAGWLVREAKRLAVSAVFGALVVEGLYALLRYAPSAWPWYATAGWVGINVVLARIFPTVVLPLFYKTEVLGDDALVRRLVALCRRVGVSALGVFRLRLGVETRKANAALAGLGKTRRVLLSDTLLERFTEEEIETVLAHELGHHQHRHITKLLLLSGLGSWLAFVLVDASATWWVVRLDVQGLADIAGFPALMLCLSLIGLVGLPMQSAVSRRFEWQADRFAVTTTKLPAAFASALKKLGELNLADPNPPAWVEAVFYDHPAITKRIAAAEAATRSR